MKLNRRKRGSNKGGEDREQPKKERKRQGNCMHKQEIFTNPHELQDKFREEENLEK